jgi:predicted transcriptional regulator
MSRFARLINAVPPSKSAPENDSHSEVSQPQESSQPPDSSQLLQSSQLSEQPRGGHESSQLLQSSQLQENPREPSTRPPQSSQPLESRQLQESRLNLLASLPEAKGHMETPFQLLDHLFRHLDPFEQAAYMQLCRLSWGWKQDRCRISNPRLAERSSMSLAQVKKVVAKLISKGLIEKTGNVQGFGKDQGVEYLVHAPSWQISRSRQLQLSRQPQSSSQLSQSTNKENINIDQKGEMATPNFQNCPDCFGTGYFYPNGGDKGVARCKHNRLQTT